MNLKDMLDPEEYKAFQWGKSNIPDRSFSPNDAVLKKVKAELETMELSENERELILSKAKNLMETQSISFEEEDSDIVITLVSNALSDINQEFENLFEL